MKLGDVTLDSSHIPYHALFRVKFYDKLLLDGHRKVFTDWKALYNSFQVFFFQVEPLGDSSPYHSIQRISYGLGFLTFFPDLDNVSHFYKIRRNINLSVIYEKVVVPDKVSALVSRIHKSQAINHIIKSSFQYYEKIGSCYPLLIICFLKRQSELFFGKAVHPFYLLLFTELNTVVRNFSSTTLPVLPRWVASSVKRALIRVTAVTFKK